MAAIQISSANVTGWQGQTTGVQLRIYTNAAFTASSGNLYLQSILTNPASLGSFFQVYNCNVSGTIMSVPTVNLDSTTDSTDNPGATFTAILFDSASGKPIQAFGTEGGIFGLAPTPNVTTWGNIFMADIDDID